MNLKVGIFAPLVLLSGTAIAQADLSALAQLPTCTQECSAKVLGPTQCQLTDLPQCFCTNTTLQRELALCVVDSCNLTEQAISLTITQNDICIGVPQPSRSAEIIRDIAIIAAVTFPVILLRFVSRSMVSSSLWWDDWAVALAAAIMIPMTIIPVLNATNGFGKHFWDVPPGNLFMLRKLYYISQIFYVVVQSLAKFSILLLYLRIFLSKTFRLVTMIAVGWMICHTIAFVIVVSFQCTPVDAVWDISVPGKCINSQSFVYAAAGFSILEDIVIMLLPIWELKDLKLDLRKRIALGFMFALGSFACITSMIRLKYIISYGTSIDLTFDNVDVIIWSVLETFTAIICACLMCLRPLLVRCLPALFPASKGSESRQTPNPSWAQVMSSKLASKLRSGNNGMELHSEDGERGGQEKVIRVQKTWVTETSIELQDVRHDQTSL